MKNNLFVNMNKLEKKGAQPKNTVESVETSKEDSKSEEKIAPKQQQPQRKRMKRGKYKKLPKSVEFATNLKISNHQRNALRVIALIGHAKNQKDAIDFLIDRYRRGLRNEAKTQFDSMVKMLNDADSEYYAKTHKKK